MKKGEGGTCCGSQPRLSNQVEDPYGSGASNAATDKNISQSLRSETGNVLGPCLPFAARSIESNSSNRSATERSTQATAVSAIASALSNVPTKQPHDRPAL